jgi:hypothetical protein
MLYLHKIIFSFCFLFILTRINSQKIFCSSYCSYSYNDCTGIAQNQCNRCAPSIFISTPGAGNICTLKTPTALVSRDLPDATSVMNLTTFVVSNSTNQSCVTTSPTYLLSGRYIDKDYISKNYTISTAPPINHYQVVIRFSIAYVGTWSSTQYLNFYAAH